jgi:SSS family solute:Na+ symporter
LAWIAFTVNFIVTIFVSWMTRPRAEESLKGLVYGLTPMPVAERKAWYLRPVPLAILVAAACLILNLIFV